jgi:hypothetical protein
MQSNRESDPKLQALKTELDAWRTQQAGRKQIPQQLWDKAIELLNSHSVGTLSRVLRLDYKRLRSFQNSSCNGKMQGK